MTTYIIEHLEEKMWPWCFIEYKHISEMVGNENLWFTNVKGKNEKLEKLGKVFCESVADMKLKRVCVLDPEASDLLVPCDKSVFDYFVFGGILGDHPPRQRTKVELTSRIGEVAVRHIGKEQMSTDNAVFVVHEILDGKRFEEMTFQDEIEIELGKNESTILPYRYPLVHGKPLISSELVEFLKKKKGF